MATVRTLKKLPTQVIVNRCVFARQRKLFDGLPMVEKSKSELIEEALKINKSFRI